MKRFNKSSWHGVIGFWLSMTLFYAGYGVLFWWAFPERPASVGPLGLLPITAIGWRYGIKGGVAAGLLSTLLHAALLVWLGLSNKDVLMYMGGLGGIIVSLVLGAFAGYGHEMAGQLHRQNEVNQANEAALRNGEERLRNVLEGQSVGIYRTTSDGKIIYANTALRELLGYSDLEELFSINVEDIFAEEGKRNEWKNLVETQGSIRSFPVRLRRKDGSEFWAEDIGRSVLDDAGRVLYFEGSLIDIDQRVRAEQALRESRRNYRQLFDSMIDGFAVHEMILDGEGKPVDYRFLKVNPAFEILTGLKAADIVGKTVREVLPNVEERWIQIYGETALTGVSTRFEHKSKALGKTYNVVVFSPQQNQFATIFTDVTERKRMEVVLQENQARYWGLFENSPVALWQEDFSQVKALIENLRQEGVQDFHRYFDEHPEMVWKCMELFRVVDVNRATLQLYEAASKEELLTSLDQIISDETFDLVREEAIALAQGKTSFESEGRNRTKTGRVIDIQIRWAIAPGLENTAEQVFLSTIDITDRKNAEKREQRQAAKADALAEISRTFLEASLDPGAIFQTVVEKAATLVGDACVLMMVMDHELKVAAYHHNNPAAREAMDQAMMAWPAIIKESGFSRALKGGEVVFIENLSDEWRGNFTEPAAREYLNHYGLESLMILPLLEKGRVMGTLSIARDRGHAAFTDEDRAFLENLANDLALMILNTQLYALVKKQAETDALTGVHTRRYFMQKAAEAFRHAKMNGTSLSVVMLDVDHFKTVNDNYGHDVGDQVLKCVVDRCKQKLRDDDVFGRFGGEEFLVLLPDAQLSHACKLADRLRSSVADMPYVVGAKEINVTVSLGVASISDKMKDLHELLRNVDDALYVAKRAGRNRVEPALVVTYPL